MKSGFSIKRIENLLPFLVTGFFLSFLCSCAVGLKSSSPLSAGYGIHIAPGLQLGESKNSAHLVTGYNNIWFNGGGGKGAYLQFGGQLRHSFGDAGGKGFWVGGEATYTRSTFKYDNTSFKESANGISFAPMAGYRFKVAKVPVSFYAAPGILRTGKFSSGGMTSSPAFTAFLGRIGFDVHFASLLSDKGR